MRYLYLVIAVIVVWIIWASTSTGGLYELKQFNREYAHPNRSVAFLLTKRSFSESNGHWDNVHVDSCSLYMPNWKKAEKCVDRRISCESSAPQIKNLYDNGYHADIFSNEYRDCWSENRPFMGIAEWMRASRGLLRSSIALFGVWITGGMDTTGGDVSEWEDDNKWWTTPVLEWSDRGI